MNRHISAWMSTGVLVNATTALAAPQADAVSLEDASLQGTEVIDTPIGQVKLTDNPDNLPKRGHLPSPPGPFNWIDHRAQRLVLLTLTALLVASSAWLFYMDRNLVSDAAPNGIVSFELAGSLERSEAILQSWSGMAHSTALLVQGFDYLYLFIYPAWFSLAAISLGGSLGGRWQTAGLVIGWSVLASAPLDAVENYALIQQLLEGPAAASAALALWCALPKFALIAVSIAFLLLASGTWVARRLT